MSIKVLAVTYIAHPRYDEGLVRSTDSNANIHGRSQSIQLYATSATISGTKFDDCHRPHNRHQHEDGDFGRLWPETENPAVIGMLIGLDLHQLHKANSQTREFTFNIKTSI